MARLNAGITKLKTYLKLKDWNERKKKNLNDWFENNFRYDDVI